VYQKPPKRRRGNKKEESDDFVQRGGRKSEAKADRETKNKSSNKSPKSDW
jgi:hypothetical protein